MSYQYNCNKGCDYFRKSQERGNAVKKHCGHDRASGSGLSIESC